MNREDEIQSKVIDFLRFPMACAVVFIHSASVKGGYFQGVHQFLSIFFAECVCRLAVPSFFLISGYLFFSKLEEWNFDIWGSKVCKRTKTLLLPYVLWNIIAFIVLTSYGILRAKLTGEPYVDLITAFHNNGGIRILWNSDSGMPADFPLWFIRDLIIYVLLTPLILFFIKTCKWYLVVVLCILFLFSVFREGAFFFIVGSYLRISNLNIIQTFRKVKIPAYVIASVCLVLSSFLLYCHIDNIFYDVINHLWLISGVVSLFCAIGYLFERGRITLHPFLAKSSFFIFATHGILILYDFANYIVLHTIPWTNEAANCAKLFIRPTVAVIICLILYSGMSKIFPKTLAILTGNRG